MINAVQAAIYNALAGELGIGVVFDAVPENKPGRYVVIGDDTTNPWDTDDANGFNMTCTIHTYQTNIGTSGTTPLGYKGVKEYMGRIYNALHGVALPVTGYNALRCIQEFSDVMRSADGISRHGVQRFRILIHK